MSETPWISTMLPEPARDRLIRAAQVQNDLDPRARQKAIEIATNVIKSQYPSYFHLKELKP